MNEEDLRDCFAMFAMLGIVINCKEGKNIGGYAYELADQMLEARNKEPEAEVGIVAVKKRRTKNV
jgi:hypothetical protein